MSSEHLAAALLPALDIAAFERNSEGSFRPLAPVPGWFARLGRDGTFPFLGHILEEATRFWASRTEGVHEWGPCADVDEAGREFHYLVKAVTIGAHAVLVFERDNAAERIREVLQKARSDALERTRSQQ
jgi:hypothetical protein